MRREDFSLRPVAPSEADIVLRWRNLESVRSRMFDSDPITPEQHAKWMKSLEGNPLSRCWLFLYRGEPHGVVTAKLYRPEKGQWIWGCYLGRPGEIKGGGTIMGFLAMEELFERIGVQDIIGEAVAANEHSLKFNDRLGFVRSGTFMKNNSQGRPVEAMLLTYPPGTWQHHKARLLGELFSG